MNDFDKDSPLGYYKILFPNDVQAEERVLNLLMNTANERTGIYHIDLENIESYGLSKLDLDIYTIAKIDALLEPVFEDYE